MTTRRRHQLVAALVFAGAIGGLLWTHSSDTLSTAVSGSASPDAEERFYGFVRKSADAQLERRVYELDATRDMAGGKEESPANIRLRLGGLWKATNVGMSSDRVRVHIQIEGAQLKATTNGRDLFEGAQRNQLESAIERPFFLTLARDGRLEGLHFATTTPPFVRRLLTSIAADAQMVIPVDSSDTWESIESDAVGTYQAEYTWDDDQLRKRKLRYTRIGDDAPVAVTVADARASASYTDARALERLDAWESVQYRASALQMTTTSSTYLELTGVESAPELADAFARDGSRLVALSPTAISMNASRVANLPKDDGDRATLPELLTQLEANLSEARSKQRHKLHRRMANLFRRDDKAAAEAGRRLESGAEGVMASVLLGTLGDADTEASRGALAKVAENDSLDSDVRAQAALHLGGATPSADSVESLRRTSRDSDSQVWSTSALALGRAARRLADSEADGATSIVEELIRRLRGAGTAAERTVYLAALGNTGDPAAVPAIREALRDPSSRVRAAAAHALRFMSTPEASELLSTVMVTDIEGKVRGRAIQAASHHPIERVKPALEHAAQSDESSEIRSLAAQVLEAMS